MLKKKTGKKPARPGQQKVLDLIIKTALEKKGADISLINLIGIFPLADYFLLVTGKNVPHLKTLAEEIKNEVYEKFKITAKKEGLPESRWLILDFGNIIVHIIGAREREYYGLDKLWSKAAVTYHY
jgi:ribosome-associated protein